MLAICRVAGLKYGDPMSCRTVAFRARDVWRPRVESGADVPSKLSAAIAASASASAAAAMSRRHRTAVAIVRQARIGNRGLIAARHFVDVVGRRATRLVVGLEDRDRRAIAQHRGHRFLHGHHASRRPFRIHVTQDENRSITKRCLVDNRRNLQSSGLGQVRCHYPRSDDRPCVF